ncbi:unnamed protein product [Calicophoron daubneyi]|uniref:Uncharacterized protein n=1 Tax=Calicophoron daubneyi TaxID=300641 RepID=A0AAV2TF11_CALDB
MHPTNANFTSIRAALDAGDFEKAKRICFERLEPMRNQHICLEFTGLLLLVSLYSHRDHYHRAIRPSCSLHHLLFCRPLNETY